MIFSVFDMNEDIMTFDIFKKKYDKKNNHNCCEKTFTLISEGKTEEAEEKNFLFLRS